MAPLITLGTVFAIKNAVGILGSVCKQGNVVRVGSIVMVAAIGAAAVTVLAVPASVTDSLCEDWRRMAGDPGQACLDHERASLADPVSASLESYAVSAADSSVVTIRYRTSSGAPDGGTEAVCVFREGKVSEEQTARQREHAMVATRLKILMADFDCLDRKEKLLRAGHVGEANRVRCAR